MEMHSGSDRRVIVGKRHTIKVARANPFRFVQSAYETTRHHGLTGLKRMWDIDADGYQGLKWFLLHGIVANQREARIAKSSRDIVVPVRTLLAGLINVQPSTVGITQNYDQIKSALLDNLDSPGANLPRLGHMLEDTSNFGIYEGKIMFRDGGSYGLERVLSGENGPSGIAKALGSLSVKRD